jgi:hypothetical protein
MDNKIIHVHEMMMIFISKCTTFCHIKLTHFHGAILFYKTITGEQLGEGQTEISFILYQNNISWFLTNNHTRIKVVGAKLMV